MTDEAKVTAALMSLVGDAVDVMFGDGSRVCGPDGVPRNEATSFAIYREDGAVFEVEITQTRKPLSNLARTALSGAAGHGVLGAAMQRVKGGE